MPQTPPPDMQKMYALPDNNGMLPINREALLGGLYSKQQHEDPLYLYDQHVNHPQEMGLIWGISGEITPNFL